MHGRATSRGAPATLSGQFIFAIYFCIAVPDIDCFFWAVCDFVLHYLEWPLGGKIEALPYWKFGIQFTPPCCFRVYACSQGYILGVAPPLSRERSLIVLTEKVSDQSFSRRNCKISGYK